jgi:para-nitrobenzyl esterase
MAATGKERMKPHIKYSRSARRRYLSWGRRVGSPFSLAVLLAACLAAFPLNGHPSSPPTVSANGESLTGVWDGPGGTIASFRGVPFASPPVGELRWRAPRPHAPRSGEQDAVRFAPACSQTDSAVDWYTGVASAFGHGEEVVDRPAGVSEDCLYLNIWSPEIDPAADLPVMVFVHGGGNSGGWSYEPNYRGAVLAARGLVVVTIAYRLGPFGFFSHPALDNADGEPVANFGLLDIRAAFGWVRNHIRAFGGDPGHITGFGESAGALDLVDLLLADLSQGQGSQSLFRRLISQSLGGSLQGRDTLADEQEIGVRLAQILGLTDAVTAAQLRAIPAGRLLAAAGKLPDDYYPDGVVDGRTLFRQPMEVIQSARADGVDLILGTNADEWLMYIDEGATRTDLERYASEAAPGRSRELLAAVSGESDPRRALDRLRTARAMMCPSRQLAAFANASGGHGRVYYFSRQRSGPGGAQLGAYHGTELPYVFGTHDRWLPTEPQDLALTETVMGYWGAFARTGDPNGPGRPQWPVYTVRQPMAMVLGEVAGAAPAPDDGLCGLLGMRYEAPGETP